jgi:hypothetical protein
LRPWSIFTISAEVSLVFLVLRINADPDPAFYINADPDPNPESQTNPDLDPG